ncbi:aminotransferase [candidate division GN15 bacterium]|uniref:Aminotransferase n=1 Tax=candidate division GN15 bacterium TaxID=2072418 RepID=A0A855X456_9BACT|nr:MAG: aminotransferase [candidate division GN15 bacterium]
MAISVNHQVQPEKWLIAPHVIRLETSIIREILKISSQPGVISFAGGLPAPELFPLEDLKRICGEVIEKYGPAGFQYALSRGVPVFVKLLAERATVSGCPTEPENVLVTAGAQQAIELVARAFIDPGDYVIVENPTYVGALQAFNYYQARYVPIEMDKEGMRVEQVETSIRKYNPKLIYTVSNFQNPTGITMSEERRQALVDVAVKYNIPLVDDNPYREIRFAGTPATQLKAIGGDAVIELHTFSKTVAPGLRIGWINGPKPILSQFEKVKQCTDLHTNSFSQYVIYEFVKQGLMDPQIEKIKANYLEKRNTMLHSLEKYFPAGVTWTNPEGGLFLWLELPKGISAKEMLPRAIERGVAYVYGSPFFAGGGGENTMRLGFSNPSVSDIVEGVKRLGTLLKEKV